MATDPPKQCIVIRRQGAVWPGHTPRWMSACMRCTHGRAFDSHAEALAWAGRHLATVKNAKVGQW